MNTFFQFKQFTIHQDQCAMKVCTDACIFGALVAAYLKEKSHQRLLDIGAGTGLLSLMVAQENSEKKITALEINKAAFLQAKENTANAIFAKNVALIEQDVLTYHAPQPFDFIFSNPPFFEGDLKSNDKEKNLAKHAEALTLARLLDFIQNHLSDYGETALLLPWHRHAELLTAIAPKHLSIVKMLCIKQTPKHDFFRAVYILSKNTNQPTATEVLIIKQENNSYSTEFQKLLQKYYLHL